ncbi:helix-turn-helix transcriptional regulator [Arthrobacter alpinus]|uniref:helix-turn-helix transcriptional regulator n=1 Tax=Arthrobacter alpinus TaxID=656366 RepID=UPI00138F30F0|nr:LuxR family transcriptional regulator [Arthrobacter alpinus]
MDNRVQGVDIVGRAQELAFLGAFLSNATDGLAGTLIVSGDAGVGKTALVQHACLSPTFTGQVLTGAGLPLSATSIPLLALRHAFRAADTFDAGGQLALSSSGELSANVPVVIDEWLDGLCRHHPVVLVIDDLQWVDQGTLDVLMYLIAGPAARRLAIIGTLRSGEVGEHHPLQRWLADIWRMPRIESFILAPLNRPDTEAQLSSLFGEPPHQSLVQDVFDHTAGNAYLNRLVIAGLEPTARHLPAELPADLKGAVLRSWRGLSEEARQLTQLMAVGGLPLPSSELGAISELNGGSLNVLGLLREGANAGILECSLDGQRWWFHHPLIAEALQHGLDGDERAKWHAIFAAYTESKVADQTTPDFSSLAALANHYYLCGRSADAYHWALRACAGTGLPNGAAGQVELLRRAVDLHSKIRGPAESRYELLTRLRWATEVTGDPEAELESIEALLADIDFTQQPLDAAELLVRRALLRFSTGREFISRSNLLRAVELSGSNKQSWQYAYALAEFAHVGLWNEDPDAPGLAAEALSVARNAGNSRALSFALTANSMAALLAGHPDEARPLAAEAANAAAQARDFWALLHATIWQANATEAWTSQDFAELMRAGRELLSQMDAPHLYLAKMAADEASSCLSIGRWQECEAALRVALGANPGAMGDVAARLTATRLAALQGRQGEAEAHLARAEEIYSQSSTFNNLDFNAVRAELLVTGGKPAAAFAAAMAGLSAEGQPPTMCEWLLPLAARALADQIQEARDEGRAFNSLMAALDELVLKFPRALQESGLTTEHYDHQVEAFNLLYQAEVGRARKSPGNAMLWIRTADSCAAGALRWEECYCLWRAAESLLIHGHSLRPLASSMLRRGLSLANELQALPVQTHLLKLAQDARISTLGPVVDALTVEPAPLPGLTRREHEVLAFVIAGQSYAQIAESLVISQKTVSTHISNLLRKTGTSNRIDLTRLATRPVR